MLHTTPCFLLSLTLGCTSTPKPETTQSKDTAPWSDLQAQPPESFRLLRTTAFPDAVAPSQLLVDPILGPALALDAAAGVVWATDKLYLHDPRIACLHPSDPAKIQHFQPGQGCPTGTIETRRGRIDIGSEPAAMAIDPEAGQLAILDHEGHLYWVEIDPMSGPSIDHMRPAEGAALSLSTESLSGAQLAISTDMVALGVAGVVSIFTPHGIRTERFDAAAPINDLIIDAAGWWALTDDQLIHNGESAGPGGDAILMWDGTPWIMGPDTIYGPEQTLSLVEAIGVGAVWGDRLLIATTSGITQIASDLSQSELWTGAVIDLATNNAGEVVVLQADGKLSIFVDERTPADAAPLHVWINTFLERPRHDGEIRGCTMDDPLSLSAMHSLASAQLALFDNLPAPTALGITPNHMREVLRCAAQQPLAKIIEGTDVGILFHETPTNCASDETCYQAALAADLDTFESPVGWVSGLTPHTDLDVDWVATLAKIGAPDRFNFFGSSIRPDVPHADDLRAKEAWPLSLNDHTQIWAADTALAAAERHASGALKVLPGNNVSAFNLGACPNLFVTECHPLGRGDGSTLSDADIESLDLLLHRALRSARGDGIHTWNFHIPDIGIYDFTEDCTVDTGIWSGDDCEGARLQAWLFDAHQRFALNGRIVWSSPALVSL
jgi:hypothetical protein